MVKMSCRERNRQTEEENRFTITIIVYRAMQIRFDGQPNTH